MLSVSGKIIADFGILFSKVGSFERVMIWVGVCFKSPTAKEILSIQKLRLVLLAIKADCQDCVLKKFLLSTV